MRNLAKSAVLGTIMVSALMGAAGAASADTGPVYAQHSATANGDGASSSGVLSSAGSYGGVDGDATGPSYAAGWQAAGPDGAATAFTGSGFNGAGQAYYVHGWQAAGPDGASTSSTFSRS